MADKAVGHLRKVGGGDFFGSLEAAMTGCTGIIRYQIRLLYIRRIPEISLSGDCLRDRGPNIVELGVHGMIELRDCRLSRRLDLLGVLVAARANGGVRQQTIGNLHASCGGRMTDRAGKLLF